jgi:hypothetical protein
LQDVFKPAAVAANKVTLASEELPHITQLGRANQHALNALFNFATPSTWVLGLAASPIANFTATYLGSESDVSGGHTALGLSIPHIIVDGQGAFALIKEWGQRYQDSASVVTVSDLPARREADMPAIKGVTIHSIVEVPDRNPDLHALLETASTGTQVERDDADRLVASGYQTSSMDALRYIFDTAQLTVKGVEEQYIHIPSLILERIRDEARRLQGDVKVGLPVSKMDVFGAIMLKVCLAISPSSM